jgi:Ca2+-dependent lipid-binding protein
LIAEDDDGLSDPYVKIVFGHRTGKTKIVKKSLCPTWDQVRSCCPTAMFECRR